MTVDDMIIVSVDDHVVEPPNVFDGRVPPSTQNSRQRSFAPSTATTCGRSTVATIPNIGLNAVAGRPREEYGVNPTSFEEMRPGCWDIHERVKDMSAGGVLACLCFPSFPSFSGRLFANTDDKGPRARRDPGVQRLAHRRVVRHVSRALHPDGAPDVVGSRADRRRDPPRRRQGLPLAQLHREPRGARLPELPRRALGPDLARAGRRRRGAQRPPGVVGQARDHRPTRRWT